MSWTAATSIWSTGTWSIMRRYRCNYLRQPALIHSTKSSRERTLTQIFFYIQGLIKFKICGSKCLKISFLEKWLGKGSHIVHFRLAPKWPKYNMKQSLKSYILGIKMNLRFHIHVLTSWVFILLPNHRCKEVILTMICSMLNIFSKDSSIQKHLLKIKRFHWF